MTELEVKRCIISSAGEINVILFGQGETLTNFFQNQEDIDLLVEMDIGKKGKVGNTTFSLRIVSVDTLHTRQLHLKRNPKSKHLVFTHCCWQKVETRLMEIIRSCSGYSYDDCCEQLCNYFNWEYEGM